MALTKDEVDDLHAGNFVLHALQMQLNQLITGEPVYSGSGEVRQNENGTLRYTLFDTERLVDDWNFPETGKWVPEERLLALTLQDWRGRTWKGSRTDPSTNNVMGEKGVVCMGDLHELTCMSESYVHEGDSLVLFFPGEFRIPFTNVTRNTIDEAGRASYRADPNLWLIETPDLSIRIRLEPDGLNVEAISSRQRFPSEFDSRVMEALWLVLAIPTFWQFRRKHNSDGDHFTIRKSPGKIRRPRLQPPLRRDEENAGHHLGRMLSLYLDHLSKFTSSRIHPTSVQLRQVLLASATFIEMEALALAVAVESILRSDFADSGTPDPGFVEELESAIEHMEKWKGSEGTRKRLQKLLGNLRGANPRRSLSTLLERGVLYQAHVDAWNRIRHPQAHGLELSAPFRDQARLCSLTYGTFLRLLFEVIGYAGPYTDYGSDGWPLVQYP